MIANLVAVGVNTSQTWPYYLGLMAVTSHLTWQVSQYRRQAQNRLNKVMAYIAYDILIRLLRFHGNQEGKIPYSAKFHAIDFLRKLTTVHDLRFFVSKNLSRMEFLKSKLQSCATEQISQICPSDTYDSRLGLNHEPTLVVPLHYFILLSMHMYRAYNFVIYRLQLLTYLHQKTVSRSSSQINCLVLYFGCQLSRQLCGNENRKIRKRAESTTKQLYKCTVNTKNQIHPSKRLEK